MAKKRCEAVCREKRKEQRRTFFCPKEAVKGAQKLRSKNLKGHVGHGLFALIFFAGFFVDESDEN